MTRRVTIVVDDDTADVLATLCYVEGRPMNRLGVAAREIVAERCAHLLKHDSIVRQLVAARRRARLMTTGQRRLRLVGDDD